MVGDVTAGAKTHHRQQHGLRTWDLEDLDTRGARPLALGSESKPITLEELTLALSNRIGLDPDEIAEEANFVMDIFGFDDRVTDNVLQREDRQLFYSLEEEGMMSTDREETTLYDGREWRTHYWNLRKDTIRQYAHEERSARRRRTHPNESDIYHNLPPDLWMDRRF